MNRVPVMMAVVMAVAMSSPVLAKSSRSMSFAVSRDGKVTGRMDVNISKRDSGIFAVSSFVPGVAAVKEHKNGKPSIRTYAELDVNGAIGKFKRWEVKGKGDRYWFAFVYDGKVKVRHEKGAGDKGSTKELGVAAKTVPLDIEQPHLAWMLIDDHRDAVECVGLKTTVLGKATVQKVGDEDLDVFGGGKKLLTHWAVRGDCGEYSVYVDADGLPTVMVSGSARFDRM